MGTAVYAAVLFSRNRKNSVIHIELKLMEDNYDRNFKSHIIWYC